MKIYNSVVKGLVAATFVAGLASCQSFLDEYNPGNQTVTFFETAEGFETEVNGAYSSLRSVYNNGNYLTLTWMGTDLFTQSGIAGLNNLNQYTSLLDNREGAVSGWWNSLYGALMAVNSTIEYGAKVQGMDAKLIEQRVAEMKGLRALYLFEIVRNWGDAPLMNYSVSSPEYNGRRDPAADIYAQILADLQEAIAALPASYAGNNFGRFSSSAARHLRALVYLTRGYSTIGESTDFANAYADATAVVDGSDHSLIDDYGQVHRYDNQTNPEIILSVQFSLDAISGKGNKLNQYLIFPYREGYTGGAKDALYGNDDNSFMPTKYAYMMFDWAKDKRAQVTYMSSFNGDPTTSTDGKTTGHNWMQVTQAVTGRYVVGDASLIFPTPAYSEAPPADKIKADTQTIPYPTGDVTNFSPDGEGNAYWTMGGTPNTSFSCRTYLPVWKFRDNNTEFLESSNNMTGTRDTYLFRVGETCLIAAEAAMKAGDNANALKYLNMVRARAEINPGDLVYPEGTTVTIDMILDERALELFGESSRWNDLQRTGKLVERVRKYNWDVNNLSTGTTQLTEGSTKFYLRPIPLAWIQSLRNHGDITNNPGWE